MPDQLLHMPATPSDARANSLSKGSGHTYNEVFFRYIHQGAIRSAGRIVPLAIQGLGIKSVLDVGCGAGAWLSVYRQQGVADILGVDGAYVREDSLLVPPQAFQARDITQPFDLRRQFDLVQCLEVGEHVPKAASKSLVENLVRHGKLVLFSAAIPGQGGEHHINEQPCEFWRHLFNSHGYKPFDFIRPLIKDSADVESWYRYNVLLYAAPGAIPALPAIVAATRVPNQQPIPNVCSTLYRFRTKAFSFLPVSCLTFIALAKHRVVLTYRAVTR